MVRTGRDAMQKRKDLVIDAGSVSERGGCGKAVRPDQYSGGGERVSVRGMDKKEINSTKLTLNFLFWIGGVFMLLLFAFLAHFVWRIF